MILQKLYNKGCVEYPLDLDLHQYTFHIEHETCFCPYFTSWAVTMLDNGDMIYIPCGENKRKDIYIVSYYAWTHQVPFPCGIYTLPMRNFTCKSSILQGVI